MKKILVNLFFLVFISLFFQDGVFANNYIEKTLDGHKFKVIKYDLSSKDFIFKVGAQSDYEALPLRELMENNNGISAINGVYFCPADYAECGGKDFTANERYINGKKISAYDSTGVRVVFALDKDNKPFLYQTDKINSEKEVDISNGIANFPLLLQDGESKVDIYSELGLIDSKMKVKMSRNFICSDKEKRYIFFGYVYDIEILNLPSLLLKFGCYDAINLDAGSSSAMIYNSRYLIGPGRNILDGLIIERKGLDTSKILKNAKSIMLNVENLVRVKESITEKTDFLDKLSSYVQKIRTKIYETNSYDLYNEDGKKVGYEISITKLNNLSKLYLINYLDSSIKVFKVKLMEEEKMKNNIESLLF